MGDTHWAMIGDLKVVHRRDLKLDAYPEDERLVHGWRHEGSTDIWAQALHVPVKHQGWALALGGYMSGYGYKAALCQGTETVLLVYMHPALELRLVNALAEPQALK